MNMNVKMFITFDAIRAVCIQHEWYTRGTNTEYEKLHDFLFDAVYLNPIVKSEEIKVEGIVSGIYEYLIKNPDKLDNEYAIIREREGVERAAVDYIAGMTDHFAVTKYSDIYIPKEWKV